MIENFFFKFIFRENIHWRQSQEYRIFGFVRYLPTPELEIFIGIAHWRQSQEHERKNKKRKNDIFIYLFNDIRIMNKKENILIFS
jgi:hypothetical protein